MDALCAAGTRYVELGEFLYIDSDMHQSYSTVTCTLEDDGESTLIEARHFVERGEPDGRVTVAEALRAVAAACAEMRARPRQPDAGLRPGLAQMMLRVAEEAAVGLREKERADAARVISRAWYRCLSDPAHPACVWRLRREFDDVSRRSRSRSASPL